MGMKPVLPAFSGHVPPSFKEKFPTAKIKKTNWGAGFDDVYILDPADPMNFAQYLKLKQLPDLLADQTGATPMTPKKVLGQRAQCDATVPDVFQILLYNNVGLTPLSLTSSQVTVFTSDPTGAANNPFVCPSGLVAHGFLTNWTSPNAGSPTLTTQAQNDIANFFQTDALPAPVRVP